VDDNGQRGAGGQRHLRQRFFGRGNQDGVRSAAIKTVGAPIHPLAVGVISEVDHRFALWKDPCWPSYRRAVGPTPEGRTRPSEAVAHRATAGTASGQSNPLPRENSVGKEGALLLSLAPPGPRLNRKGNLAF
jgi:hypothetical protein